MFKESSKGVQVRWRGISSSFMGIARVEYLKEVQQVCQESFNGISTFFKGVSRKFQGSFCEVSRVFPERFMGI